MSQKFGIEIPRIENEDIFEDLCLDLCKANIDYENSQRNGRRGQRQNGVDIFARKLKSLEWIGIQCKVKTGDKIEKNEINDEINKALTFNPRLTNYYIYTTAKRDAKIQEHIRKINDNNTLNGLFNVEIIFWEDIETMLREDAYKSVHYKYYRELYTNFKDDGYSFGKLVGLTVAYHDDESYYELLIGKIYKDQDRGIFGINYWKNVNFIMNMNERAFETFPKRCFPSDLESAIRNPRDRYIISEWINSIDDIENFLKSDEEEYKFSITDEQFKEYLSSCDED